MGPHNSNLKDFLAIFSNFVGLPILVQETPISKLILDSQIQGAHSHKQGSPTPVERHGLVQAYSDASDHFYQSDDSSYMYDFMGHATESDRRPPISTPEEIKKSKFNRAICRKSKFVTSENCLPTKNLNTQAKIYRKSLKNKRRHIMTTRSQSREFPWVGFSFYFLCYALFSSFISYSHCNVYFFSIKSTFPK
ncbi:unnamed protein product, partial [Cuscuta europaea]